MARQLKLVRLDDFIADVDDIDLLADGFDLAVDGYLPAVAPIGAKSVNEVITLKLQGTSKDDLAAMTQEIDEKIKQVQWWIEAPGVEKYQIWLRAQLDNETYPRQAQVLNIRPPDKVRVYNPPEINANWIGEYQIGIERTPFWEQASTGLSEETHTGIVSVGGMTALSNPVVGDVAARLLNFNALASSSGSGTKELDDFWVGIKTDRFGTPANFEPRWLLHDASTLASDTTSQADAAAYDGNTLVCDFSYTGGGFTPIYLLPRATMQIKDAVADSGKYGDQRGSYQVLLRAKTSSDTKTVMVRMAYGYANASGVIYVPNYRSLTPVTGTDYVFYDLGVARFPPNRSYPGALFDNIAIELDAEKNPADVISLYMDCLVLIPIDDAFVKMTTAKSHITTAIKLQAYQWADNSLSGYVENSGVIYNPVIFEGANKWGMPLSGTAAQIIMAAQAWNKSDKLDKINIGLTYLKRWRTLRGNEA